MKCPHCGIHFHADWLQALFLRDNNVIPTDNREGREAWFYRSALCPECREYTIQIGGGDLNLRNVHSGRPIYPTVVSRGPISPEVPTDIAEDYAQACSVLPVSSEASAALSRRCLQKILRAAGYSGRDLSVEVDLLLNEADPRKAIPQRLRSTIDAIRNFGNFSAHPIDDKTTLQIIDVEPEEAEWCLEIIEELFEHFYIGPAQAKAKKDALDAKLLAAGKPPSKG